MSPRAYRYHSSEGLTAILILAKPTFDTFLPCHWIPRDHDKHHPRIGYKLPVLGEVEPSKSPCWSPLPLSCSPELCILQLKSTQP